jgi:hypothetical protein
LKAGIQPYLAGKLNEEQAFTVSTGFLIYLTGVNASLSFLWSAMY